MAGWWFRSLPRKLRPSVHALNLSGHIQYMWAGTFQTKLKIPGMSLQRSLDDICTLPKVWIFSIAHHFDECCDILTIWPLYKVLCLKIFTFQDYIKESLPENLTISVMTWSFFSRSMRIWGKIILCCVFKLCFVLNSPFNALSYWRIWKILLILLIPYFYIWFQVRKGKARRATFGLRD